MPVIIGALSAKSRLSRPGSSTLATPIPAPAASEPTISVVTLPNPRMAVPMASVAIASRAARSSPIWRTSQGATAANTPRQITGAVDITLAPAADSPVSAITSFTTGAKPDSAGRRLKAINTIATASGKRSCRWVISG